MTATLAPTAPGRWVGGVFRQLRHWIPEGAQEHHTRFGVTSYAASPCYSPCVDRPHLAQVVAGWRRCRVCLEIVARADA